MSSNSRPLFRIKLQKTTHYKSLEESSGVVIRGSLLFTPTFPIKVNRILLRFQGKYAATSTKDFRKSENILIENQWIFFDAGKKSQTISGGAFKYDFEMNLPEELPESCKSEYGNVQYKFKAIAETSLLYSNLKDEKEVFLRQNVSSWLDTVYPTEVVRHWRNIVDINMKIPSSQYTLGSVLPLTFRTQLSDESARVVLVACMLKEHMILRSPKIHGSSRPVIRDQGKNIDMAFTWCKDDNYNEEKVMKINIPFNKCTFDCSNEFVTISHKLRVRVDIEKQGIVESVYISFPILIVPQISSELSFDELGIEQLPGYQVIPPPPSYDDQTSVCSGNSISFENLNFISFDSNEQFTPFPPRYSTIVHNISVY